MADKTSGGWVADAAIVEYVVRCAAWIYEVELEGLSGETTYEDLEGGPRRSWEDQISEAQFFIGLEDELDINITDEEMAATALLGHVAALVQQKLMEKQVSGNSLQWAEMGPATHWTVGQWGQWAERRPTPRHRPGS